jgi:uncharacterized protein (TIGR00255 family)
VYSMTGYAQRSIEYDDFTLYCEIKSLNNKYLELKFRLPPFLLGCEKILRQMLKSSIKRGKVEVFMRVEIKENLEFDFIKSLLKRYSDIVKGIERETDLNLQVSISELLSFRNLLNQRDEYTFIQVPDEKVVEIFTQTINLFQESRHIEGENTKKDLLTYIREITSSIKRVEKKCPKITKKYKEQLRDKINELLNSKVDEARLMMEVGIFASKVDISEEISRVHCHIDKMVTLINSNESCGRELDFIVQELNREVNTIGSKVPDFTVSEEVVRAKTSLEKIKEQVRNLE